MVLKEQTYYVYVLRNTKDRLYIGSSKNLEKRVQQHQKNKGGWTSRRGPWELVYNEQFTSRREAMRREPKLKRGKANQELHTRFSRTEE